MDFVKPITEMLDTCLTFEPAFTDIENLALLDSNEEYVYLLGMCFCSNDIKGIKAFSQSRIWCTYRKNFSAIGGTGPTNDSGWGCMLRVGQMLMAQALTVVHLGRNWQWTLGCKNSDYRRLLAMFQDNRTSLYSIHQIAQMGVSEGKTLGTWLGPNTIAQVLKKLAIYDDWSYLSIHVAMDGCLISDDVRIIAAHEKTTGTTNEDLLKKPYIWQRPLLLIIPLRLGLTTFNTNAYSAAIKEFFKLPQCAGIIGGCPNRASYFYGCIGKKLLYLDPHLCQESVNIQNNDETITNGFEVSPENFSTIASTSPNNPSSFTTLSLNNDDKNNFVEFLSTNIYNGDNQQQQSTSSPNTSSIIRLSAAATTTTRTTTTTASSTSSTSEILLPSSLPDGFSSSSSIVNSRSTESLISNFSSNKNNYNNELMNSSIMEKNDFEEEKISLNTMEFMDKMDGEEKFLANNKISFETDDDEFILPKLKNEKNEELNENLKMLINEKEEIQNQEDFDDSTYHCPFLLGMDFDSLDPSLALAFICVCEDDYEDLVERLNKSVINASSPPLFDILENRPKGWPKFVPYIGSQDESIPLKEYDDFCDSQFDSDEQFEILE